MTSKTCGECKHCANKKIIATCEHIGIVTGDIPACSSKFEPKTITNGDVIRQMSNEELAVFFEKGMCHRCIYHGEYSCNPSFCKIGIKAWLNAPADCVKQNGNDDTQADLCKTDNTEREE
jgi:hypothetical protein